MGYPRALRTKERELLESVLPLERAGYREYRHQIAAMEVIAQGRRGEGDLILGAPGCEPDVVSPLPPVIAFGTVETTQGAFAISIREQYQGQINVEIVSERQQEIPDHFEEKRRWTYSSWSPGAVSPATGGPVREILVNPDVTLGFGTRERRIWVYERAGGMVHLIPITNYYNELMRHKQIRDARIALSSANFWNDLDRYSDAELRAAFVTYNALRRRVELQAEGVTTRPQSAGTFLRSLFRRGR